MTEKPIPDDILFELRSHMLELAIAQATTANAILSLAYLVRRGIPGGSAEAEKIIQDSEAAFASAQIVGEALEKALRP